MALVDNQRQRTSMLCVLYLAQGIPSGFMTVAVISYLTERGVGDADVGDLAGVVLIPWSLKLIWGPLIDTITIRSMGRRRPWIIVAQLMMAASLLGLLVMDDPTQNLPVLGWMFFLHNCFASLQDVSTDALAIDVVPEAELGKMNGFMWCSKIVGKGLGASGSALVMHQWGFNAAVLVQFGVLLLIMLFPLLMIERPGDKRFPWSPDQATVTTSNTRIVSPIRILKDLFRAFSLRSTAVFLVFALIASTSEGLVDINTKPFYTKELGWTFVNFSNVIGVSVVSQMIGAFGGGWLSDRLGRNFTMVFGLGLYGLLTIGFAISPSLWSQELLSTGYVILSSGALALGSVAFLSMAMKISWSRVAATMFTTFMAASSVGLMLGNWLIGPLRESLSLSHPSQLCIGGVIMIGSLLLLPAVTTAEVDDARANDSFSFPVLPDACTEMIVEHTHGDTNAGTAESP